jgi:hypothetical protein
MRPLNGIYLRITPQLKPTIEYITYLVSCAHHVFSTSQFPPLPSFLPI